MRLSRLVLASLAVIVLVIGAFIFIRAQEDAADVAAVPAPSSSEGGDGTTAVAPRAARSSDSVLFDPADMVVGDGYGVFAVKDVYYTAPSPLASNQYYRARFSGTATLTGVIGNLEGMCDVTIESIAPSIAEQLPRAATNTGIPTEMFLDLSELSGTEARSIIDTYATLRAGDRVEVTIDGYSASNVPKECSGNRGFVTSVRKI